MVKRFLSLFIVATLLVSLSFGKESHLTSEEQAEKEAVELDEKSAADAVAMGALRVGIAGTLVPDASAEHPMIISDPDDQPLCKPDTTIPLARSIHVLEGYEVMVLANIDNPRKIVVDKVNHILVVSPGQGVYSIRMDKCGNSDIQLILNNEKMDQPVGHGIAVFDQSLFVSTANSVYRFPYTDGQHSPLENGQKILTNINPNNPNATPDVAINPFGYAFVPRTVDEIHDKLNPSHATIKKFNMRLIPENGFDYEKDGELHAVGTNSKGAMGFDTQARLWGLNGMASGEIKRADISADSNLASVALAEELNLYEHQSANYGFPYCMTEYNMKDFSAAAKGLGGQWAHPTFMNDTFALDEYCEQSENNVAPAFPLAPNMQAASVQFFMGTFCSVGDNQTGGTSVGLPCNWTDTPIIANHGLPGQASGHSVVRLHFDDLGHVPRWDQQPDILMQEAEPCAGSGCFSPYGLAFDGFGRLIVSSDETNEIFLLSRIYNQNAVQELTDRENDDGPRRKKGSRVSKDDDDE